MVKTPEAKSGISQFDNLSSPERRVPSIRVIINGQGDGAALLFDKVCENGHNVVGVVTTVKKTKDGDPDPLRQKAIDANVPIVNLGDINTSNKGKTQTIISVVPASIEDSYCFTEPKTGILASVFPSENTWHSLYDHDYREIANHVFSIGTAQLPDSEKQRLLGRVRDVTIDSYVQGAMGWFYKILIVGVLVLIVMVYIDKTTGVVPVIFITGALAAAVYVYATVYAKGRGEAYWQEFSVDLNSRTRTGRLPGEILKDYGADVERERDRAAMSRVSNAGPSGSAAAGALVGGLLSGLFR
jgi:hypothetical protein